MRHLFSIFKIDLRAVVDVQAAANWTVEVSQYVCNAPNGHSAAELARSLTMSDDFGGRVLEVHAERITKVDSLPAGSCVAIWESASRQVPLISQDEKGVWVQ